MRFLSNLRNFNFVISFLYFSCSACSFSFCRFVPLPTSAFILKSMYSCTHFSALYFRLSVTNSNNPCSFKFLTCREVHMRLGKRLCINYGDGRFYLNAKGNLTPIPNSTLKVTREHIDEAIEIATSSSVYSVRDQIKNGYITIAGGHRIGITGTAVIKEDKVSFIKDISGLNYRLAGEVIGAADEAVPMILKRRRNKKHAYNITARSGRQQQCSERSRGQLSYKSYRVSVVDERSEIAALREGMKCIPIQAFQPMFLRAWTRRRVCLWYCVR